MRLLDADALKEDFDCVGFNDYDDYNRALRIIDNAPTVEYTFAEAFQKTVCENKLYCLARPQGKWINTSPYDDTGECSLCCYLSKKFYNFCPNCGAAMKQGEER